jgi:hypothetical protein
MPSMFCFKVQFGVLKKRQGTLISLFSLLLYTFGILKNKKVKTIQITSQTLDLLQFIKRYMGHIPNCSR